MSDWRIRMSEIDRGHLVVEERGDITIVKFTDKMLMGEQLIAAIGEHLGSLVDNLRRRNLRLDFTGVEYIASHVLGKFVHVFKKLQAVSGTLVFCNLGPQCFKTFQIAKLDKFFQFEAAPIKPTA
ncbi:MAG: STAS domain-containing protein [Planctomycetes bacterium]|nr:STAS domain-containing protein [Planctomycetota bacterium]